MPPGRRKSTHPTTSQQQRTLAFGPNSNKVTKPTQNHLPSSKSLKKLSPLRPLTTSPSPPPAPAVEEIIRSPESSLAIRESRKETTVTRSEVEDRAGRVGEKDVRRYWQGKEAERKAPRVHQQSLSLHEKILRHFDLSSQYGPCIGIPRLARWKRASKLGLNPPIEVLAVLIKEEEEAAAGDKAEKHKLQRAYMDELLDAKVGD